MQTSKIRHQFYPPDDLSQALDALAAKPGSSEDHDPDRCGRAWLERKAHHELDTQFGPRLHRQQKIALRTETTLNAMAEILDLLVAYQLALAAHQPPLDTETRHLGQRRYQQFVDQVARRLAGICGVARMVTKTTLTEDSR